MKRAANEDNAQKKPRSEKRVRTHQVKTRLNDKEYETLLRMAKIANVRPQQVLRAHINNLTLKPARIYPDEVYRAIIGLGRNWNQAVTKLHSTGTIPDPILKTVLDEIQRLCKCLFSS